MLLEVKRDQKYPFLTLAPVIEGTKPVEVIELSSDDFADFEEANRRFAEWQPRISDAPAVEVTPQGNSSGPSPG